MSSHHTKAKQLKSETALLLQIKGLEDNEENLLGIIELRDTEIEDIKSDYRRVNKENRELKEDNHFKDDQIEHDNKYQDELIKCNDSSCNDCKSLFIWTIAMAVITISALGWAYITGALLR